MQYPVTSRPVENSDPDPNPVFNVLIAYEDFETGKYAWSMYEYLAKSLKREFQFSSQMWKFDVLSFPKLVEMAVNDATLADIIVISSHGGPELPGNVRAWIDRWVQAGTKAQAIVALLDCTAEVSYPIHSYLAAIAKNGGLGFFSNSDECLAEKPDPENPPACRSNGRAGGPVSTLADVVQHESFPRWEL